MAHSKNISNKIKEPLKCGICRIDVNKGSAIHQVDPNLPIICSTCNNKFSEEDKISILNIFIVYRGFFGQYKSKEFSLLSTLKDLSKSKKPLLLNPEVLNYTLFHKALLHGITPEEYIGMLEILYEQI